MLSSLCALPSIRGQTGTKAPGVRWYGRERIGKEELLEREGKGWKGEEEKERVGCDGRG